MIKYLITIDLDGTLMQDFSTYDQATIDYLKTLSKQGHTIMIATGRPFRSSFFVYQALGLTTPIINYNGALVTNPTNAHYPITDYRISKDSLLKILDYIKTDLINVFCEIHDDIYVHDYNYEIHDYLHTDGGTLTEGPLDLTLPDNPNGALLFIKKDGIRRLVSFVEEQYSTTLKTRHWLVNNINIVEIYNNNVNKATAMLEAAKYYQIAPKNIIAFGDGINDIEMIKAAHYGIVMANGVDELKQHATFITSSVDQQGVLNFLQNFFKSCEE